jgi:hypothetical protein
VFVPLALAALLTASCSDNASRFTKAVRGLHDTLASTPTGSEASVIYPVTPGARATLVFLPAGARVDYGHLRASGLAPELARQMSAELEYLGVGGRPMLVVAQSGRLKFSTAFADWADVTDVVFGNCSGRCRVTLRAAGPGVRPRVVKVG